MKSACHAIAASLHLLASGREAFQKACFLLLLSFAGACLGADKNLTVTWLDMPVHGLAAVLETPSGQTFVVDCGGVQQSANSDFNGGRDAVAPFLAARGVQTLAAILISHPHADHYGGASWLLNNLRVEEFIDNGYEGRGQSTVYTRLRKLAVERGGRYRAVHAGDRPAWDPSLVVEVLSPPGSFLSLDADPAKVSEHGLLNSNSILLRVQHGKNVFLFPGDSYGGAFERHLQQSVPAEKLKATVLTAPHHGFNPGIDFPKMTSPAVVVVSCVADYPGNANTPYPRSPGEHATKVFGALGAQVLVTAWHGHVSIVSDGETVKTKTQREPAR